MKISFFNKKLWGNFLKCSSLAFAIIAAVLTFVDIKAEWKLILGSCYLVGLIIMFFIMLFLANRKDKLALKINNSTVYIKFANIFEQRGLKLITFNEYFDTVVDDIIIAKNTLNGQYLLEIEKDIKELDKKIVNNSEMQDRIIEENVDRKSGKKIKYKLGSIFKNGNYLLLALTHFDKDNRAYLSLQEYTACLMNMWNEIDILYNGQTVNLPLLGSGITRFKDCEVTDQELLEIILWTYRISKVKFTYPSSLNIILNVAKKDKINLYKIKGE